MVNGMKSVKQITLTALILMSMVQQGCTVVTGPSPGKYPAAPPPQPIAFQPQGGSLYQASTALSLFNDVKAHRVGDTLTVQFAERMQASKSANTDVIKESTVSTGLPTLLGKAVTRNGLNILANDWESEQEFIGEGSSSQSNSLNGSMTVTVAEVYPNGNLLIRGEKWLTLNQGEEYVQVTGIVRPSDINPSNTVSSLKIADARITYSGTGDVANSNKPGLLTKFFMKFWPL